MKRLQLQVGWLVLAALVSGVRAQQPFPATGPEAAGTANVHRPSSCLPFDDLPASIRASVRRVVEQPTLSASGPVEEFPGRPSLYYWLLDHPDRASQAWRRLGAPCLEITDRGAGRFGWADSHGSDVHWDTIYASPQLRIWYAEGRARPGLLLPPLPVRAVVALYYSEDFDFTGQARICHHADLFLHTDSKTAALVARLVGPSAPRLTQQCISQLEVFFSALARYLDRHPELAETLLFGPPQDG